MRVTQQVALCTRVNRLWSGRFTTDSHMCCSAQLWDNEDENTWEKLCSLSGPAIKKIDKEIVVEFCYIIIIFSVKQYLENAAAQLLALHQPIKVCPLNNTHFFHKYKKIKPILFHWNHPHIQATKSTHQAIFVSKLTLFVNGIFCIRVQTLGANLTSISSRCIQKMVSISKRGEHFWVANISKQKRAFSRIVNISKHGEHF